MRRKVTREKRESQIAEKCAEQGYEFIGWVDDYIDAHSQIRLSCPKDGHGEWSATINNVVNNGSGCPACAGRGDNVRSMRAAKASENCARRGLEFVGWDSVNPRKIVVRCPEHGEWSAPYGNVVHHNTGCAKCNGGYRYTASETIDRINILFANDNLEFIGWIGRYGGVSRSRAQFNCRMHGLWESAVRDVIYSDVRCPSCSIHGFDSGKPSTLYCLISECSRYVKIGISNDHTKRHAILRSTNPFPFECLELLHSTDGICIAILERVLLNDLESANMKGFDGATEWRLWEPKVSIWFDMMRQLTGTAESTL